MTVVTVTNSITKRSGVIALPERQYWMHGDDYHVLKTLRDCAAEPLGNTNGCPAVWILREPNLKVKLTRDWQFYLVAINYAMNPKHITPLLGWKKAFTNMTGFGKPGEPKRNYITGEGMSATEDPRFDKDRTCSLSMLSGIVAGDSLIVRVLDGNRPPPLKEGRKYPQRLEDIDINDYLYNPRDNWDLFFAANVVNRDGALIPFPNGAIYPWYFNGRHPVTFMPHVSREVISYPLDNLIPLPLGTPRILPYADANRIAYI